MLPKCAILQFCYLKTLESDPKDHNWGHLGALSASSWGILKNFAPLLGRTGAALLFGTLKSKRSWAQGMLNAMVSWSLQRRQQSPQKGPKE